MKTPEDINVFRLREIYAETLFQKQHLLEKSLLPDEAVGATSLNEQYLYGAQNTTKLLHKTWKAFAYH